MTETAPDTLDRPERRLPDDGLMRSLVEPFDSATASVMEVGVGRDHDVILVEATDYYELVANAKDLGFDAFVDLCGVDYLRRRPRFEVVVNLLSYEAKRRIRIRTGVEGDEPHLSSITSVFPGANFFERETYDLFGIVFDGHPDLTRILMPDDWEGHPLRKDYAVGSVPVQFKGSHKAL